MAAVKAQRLIDAKSEIQKLYWKDELSHREIGEKFGCSRQLLSKLGRLLGITGVKTASRHKGERHARWNGGRFFSENTGVLVYQRHGRHAIEHRVIAEKALGRKLKKTEVVHHVNGDKYDNRNCNLLVCTRPYHMWLHGEMSRRYMQEKFGGK